MLQEALEKPSYSPAEVAVMLTSFIESELPAGGASAEKRFFELFPTLCARVFGVISATDYQHETGGWLSREMRWQYKATSSAPKSGIHHPHLGKPKSPTIRDDPVVILLGTGGKKSSPLILIDSFAKEAEHRQNVRYDFPFLGLPKYMQDEWLTVIQASLGGTAWAMSNSQPSENSSRLFGSLFRATPRQQTSLLVHQRSITQKKVETQRRPLQLNPMFSSPNSVQSPMTPMALSFDSPGKSKDDAPPQAQLSMLEYYFLVFVRYPLNAPPPLSSSRTSLSSSRIGLPQQRSRSFTPYGDTVYYELFDEYSKYYIPISETRGNNKGFPSLQRPSELFVRLVAALWLESRNRLDATAKACADLNGRRGMDVSLDLSASFDLVNASHKSLPSLVSSCLTKLILRVIIDAEVANLSNRLSIDDRGKEEKLLCLSPAIEILQLPFYNHIRNAFRHASIHGSGTFYRVLDDWLMWIEPWNTQYPSATKSSRGIRYSTPKYSQKSSYTSSWEAYIASNLHFYTVPLAIFLRRARELDFSQRYYKKSVETVLRVLRVYSADVVAVINRLLEVRNVEATHAIPFAKMVFNHEKQLGVYAPPKTSLSLSSLQDDMKTLLEEIHLQQLKNAEKENPIEKWFEKVFGGGSQHIEKKHLDEVVANAKVIFGFPSDFTVAPLNHRAGEKIEREDKMRTADGHYTENGLRHAAIGDIKCKPHEIGFNGDIMYTKPQGYEIAAFVTPLINASIKLNERFGFENKPKPGFVPRRVNLRFFADYRNLLWCIIGLYLFCHFLV